jgi:hypothetical protein
MPISAPSRSARLGSWLTYRYSGLCARLANRETALLTEALRSIRVDRPVFIAGLARSGSTILLEALASCESFASARYSDYPPIWFPWWWSQLKRHLPTPVNAPSERAHGDGIAVTVDSPEAFDEVFWMHFFPHRHDPAISQRLTALDRNPHFDQFYRDQIRKILLARGRPRYLCKGNYNLARLPYLLSLFPDAKFVVPIRHPKTHVASLQQQHQRFAQAALRHPSIAHQMARSGHFEFGPQRRAEHAGDAEITARMRDAFTAGRDVEGYALQWAQSYAWLANLLASEAALAAATLVVRHEDVCQSPKDSLQSLVRHVELVPSSAEDLVNHWSPRMHAAKPSNIRWTAEQEACVRETCGTVAAHFGYTLD